MGKHSRLKPIWYAGADQLIQFHEDTFELNNYHVKIRVAYAPENRILLTSIESHDQVYTQQAIKNRNNLGNCLFAEETFAWVGVYKSAGLMFEALLTLINPYLQP